MITKIAMLFVATGLMIFFLSLPLINRKVPRNALYGIRIRRSMVSDERWYETNEYGGRQLARWSWLITVVGVIGFWVPPERLPAYTVIGTAAALIATLIPTAQVLIWSRKTDRSRK